MPTSWHHISGCAFAWPRMCSTHHTHPACIAYAQLFQLGDQCEPKALPAVSHVRGHEHGLPRRGEQQNCKMNPVAHAHPYRTASPNCTDRARSPTGIAVVGVARLKVPRCTPPRPPPTRWRTWEAASHRV
jgi:hypothetical protein